MSTLKHALAVSALAFGAAAPAHANLVVNGDFEQTVLSRGSFTTVTSMAGWTGTPNIEIQYNSAGSAYSGNNLIELDTNANSGMFQDILTTAGELYTVSFAYSPRPGVAVSSNGIDFTWNGALVQNVSASGLNLSGPAWTVYTYSLRALGSTSRIGFAATGTSDSVGGYLDRVTAVAAVPEPTTVSLLGAGALLVALARRRPRRAR